jgi:blue light- and temperature-responsive anti-repressor
VNPLVSKAKDLIGIKNASQTPLVAHLSYRSKALQAFSDADLTELETSAANNNRRLDVTGIFLYNDGDFFQSIEGPAEQLESVWAKILADNRHSITEIQPLSFSPYRLYSGWNMKLFKQKNVYKSSTESYQPKNKISDILFNIVREDIWPELIKKHAIVPPQSDAETYEIHRLANLLINDRSDLPEQMLNTYYKNNFASLGNFYSFVIGPLARHLGDLSAEDIYNEFEVTIALHRALVFFRKIRHFHSSKFVNYSPRVTVANMPGEKDIISSVIDYEILWQAGLTVDLNFSKTDEELLQHVSTHQIDVLDLSQSPTQFKSSQIPRLKSLIENIHAYSLNPKLLVMLKGRGFSNLSKNSESFGADFICNISNELEKNVLEAFQRAAKVSRPKQFLNTLKTIIH